MPRQPTFEGFERPPRAKPHVIAHMIDAGADVTRFRCKKCGWDSGWTYNDGATVSQIKSGIPCAKCN